MITKISFEPHIGNAALRLNKVSHLRSFYGEGMISGPFDVSARRALVPRAARSQSIRRME